jgi:hypothetical protein
MKVFYNENGTVQVLTNVYEKGLLAETLFNAGCYDEKTGTFANSAFNDPEQTTFFLSARNLDTFRTQIKNGVTNAVNEGVVNKFEQCLELATKNKVLRELRENQPSNSIFSILQSKGRA